MNAIDYLTWRGDLEFSRDKVNEVDAMIFSWLSYYEFEKFQKAGVEFLGCSLKEIADIHKNSIDIESVDWVEIDAEVNLDNTIIARFTAPYLLYKASQTKRFDDVKVLDFKEVFDECRVVQFAAVTFEINSGIRVVAFRGTDSSIVGWKEDCMLSYLDEIPGQSEAVKYINDIDPDRKYYIVGHSKGGNEALYSFLMMDEDKVQNILGVYNFEGPGFLKKLQEGQRYINNRNLIHSFVPAAAVVGMLLEHGDDHVVVKSKSMGLLQHNAMFWQVLGTRFETEPSTLSSRTVDETFSNFLNSDKFTMEDKRFMVDTLFSALQNAGVKKFADIVEKKWFYGPRIAKSFFKYSTEQRAIMRKAASLLWQSVREGYDTVKKNDSALDNNKKIK
ncbi:MAG: DUF2974 domain-containing protein [Paludibacteraceae bacterium]|nr:DUF2974 domain-containing protein [Paludibacteraceae bacterium]